MQHRPVISVVISVLVVALVCGSFTPFVVFAVPPDPRYISGSTCDWDSPEYKKSGKLTCCWREPVPGQYLGVKYCQTCDQSTPKVCGPKERQSMTTQLPSDLPTLESVPPTALPGGDVPTLEPSEPTQPQIDPEGAPPITGEEAGSPPEPPCPEGQVLDEESGLCVLEQPEAVEEEPEQQSPEEEDGSEDNNNDNDSN